MTQKPAPLDQSLRLLETTAALARKTGTKVQPGPLSDQSQGESSSADIWIHSHGLAYPKHNPLLKILKVSAHLLMDAQSHSLQWPGAALA